MDPVAVIVDVTKSTVSCPREIGANVQALPFHFCYQFADALWVFFDWVVSGRALRRRLLLFNQTVVNRLVQSIRKLIDVFVSRLSFIPPPVGHNWRVDHVKIGTVIVPCNKWLSLHDCTIIQFAIYKSLDYMIYNLQSTE